MERDQSEIERLRRQIAVEFQAVERPHQEFASEAAKQEFIAARYARIGERMGQLSTIVGSQQAMKLALDTIDAITVPVAGAGRDRTGG